MKTALLTEDLSSGAVLQKLLGRAGIETSTFRLPPALGGEQLDARLTTLRSAFPDVIVVSMDDLLHHLARKLEVKPSLEAWITRDPVANQAVLGTSEVPEPALAKRWLHERIIEEENRRFSLVLEGAALANQLDLGGLAAFAPSFRALLTALSPTWASTQPIKRSAGRPAGVAMFRGTGYALCIELLHLGERAEITVGQLVETMRRTKTPILRLVQEAQRRGYLHRAAPRGPLRVRNTERLLEDLVIDAKARNGQQPLVTLPLSTDRDPQNLAARLALRLRDHGRILAVTGAPAVREAGGDQLLGGPLVAYASLPGIEQMLGDAYVDRQSPRMILVEPREDGMLAHWREGSPPLVSPWQAVIDLLASSDDREREVGAEVKRRLLERKRRG